MVANPQVSTQLLAAHVKTRGCLSCTTDTGTPRTGKSRASEEVDLLTRRKSEAAETKQGMCKEELQHASALASAYSLTIGQAHSPHTIRSVSLSASTKQSIFGGRPSEREPCFFNDYAVYALINTIHQEWRHATGVPSLRGLYTK